MFSNHFTTNFSQNAAVKKFWKSVNIWQRYGKILWLTFLGHPVGLPHFSMWLHTGLELPGVGVEPPPHQFMSTDAHFWVKIGFTFQSLGKKNFKHFDIWPLVLLGQFRHWLHIFPSKFGVANQIRESCVCNSSTNNDNSVHPTQTLLKLTGIGKVYLLYTL